MAQFFGKFRGTVVNNVDPNGIGRVQVQVPDAGSLTAFALPCFPPGMFAIPAIGASVWVEFEQGNLDNPIWCGVFYPQATDVPGVAKQLPPGKSGVAVEVDGVLLLRGADLATLGNGRGATLELKGPSVVANQGAWVVT
jgi:hypothetical protein